MKKYKIYKKKSKEIMKAEARHIPLQICLQDLIEGVQTDMESLALNTGAMIMKMAMEAEQSQLVDFPEAQAYRWGGQSGSVILGGQKVKMNHPRVRSQKGQEILLKSYQNFQAKTKMRESAFRDLVRGISNRAYEGGMSKLLGHYGVKKSSISRHFIDKTKEDLKKLLERDLHDWDLGVILIDGIHFAGTLLIVAMGVDIYGRKHVFPCLPGMFLAGV